MFLIFLSISIPMPPSFPVLPMDRLPPEALQRVAGYFQALAEPMRLELLNALRGGERSVGELARLVGTSTANASRHLALMAQRGLVSRTARGTSVYCAIADDTVYGLCDLVCGRMAAQRQLVALPPAEELQAQPRAPAARQA